MLTLHVFFVVVCIGNEGQITRKPIPPPREINVVSTDKRRMGIDFISSLKKSNCYGNITKMVLKARLSHGDLTIQQPSVRNVGTQICSSTNARPFVAEHVHGIATALSRFKFVLSS